ncbi:hypothetical protein MIDIC_70042 [Alphaproteobacteria bacterium]
MLIQCENCNTTFNVNPADIGANGRFVRCSQCKYEWLAGLGQSVDADVQEVKALDKKKVHEKQEGIDTLLDRLKLEKLDFNKQSVANEDHDSNHSHWKYIIIVLVALNFITLWFVLCIEYVNYFSEKFPGLKGFYGYIGIYSAYHTMRIASISAVLIPIANEGQVKGQTDNINKIRQTKIALSIKVENITGKVELINKLRIVGFGDDSVGILLDSTAELNKIIKAQETTGIYLQLPTVAQSIKAIEVYINNKLLLKKTNIDDIVNEQKQTAL